MNNKVMAVVACVTLLLMVIVLIGVLPSRDICSDDVRGYESTASSSLDATRENLRKISAKINIEERLKVPAQLDGLSVSNFAALKACDTQCKLLGQCLRFVFLASPSQACPTEYSDYMARIDSALRLLEELHRIEMASKEAEEKATLLEHAREITKESSSRSIVERQVQQLEQHLLRSLSNINQMIDGLLPNQIGIAAR